MHKYRDLKVWNRGMAFAVQIYSESMSFPRDEVFGLRSPVRRAVNGIPLNIAEGCGCSTNREFCRFLEIALRQVYETETAPDLACGLEFWKPELCDKLILEADEIAAMIVGLMKSKGWPFKP